MAHVPKSTLVGLWAERWPAFDADCSGDLSGTTLYEGGIDLVFGRENHADVRRSGYANGTLLPSLGLGFRYTVLMIVQWSW